MSASASQHLMLFPRWFRALVVALALLIMCACQSTTRLGTSVPLANRGPKQQPSVEARPPYPVQQAQYAAEAQAQHMPEQWQQQVPSEPYYAGARSHCYGCQPGTPMMGAACQTCPPSGCATCPPGPPIGPSDEYLCDGGDFHTPAGVGYDWQVLGLEQEDTIVHYDTLDGRVVVKPSNRVCIYAPRFGAVRRVENLTVNHHRVGPGGIIDRMALARAGRVDIVTSAVEQKSPIASLGDQPPNLFRTRIQPGGVQTRIALADLQNTLSPQLNLKVVRLGIIDNAEKPRIAKAIVAANTWASDISAQVVVDGKQAQQQIGRIQCGDVYVVDEPNSPRIRLIKLASTGAAQLGEEVEFTLRFDNVGDQAIGNVTIVDNLATRLEYVADSAKSTVDAEFSTEPNEGGSELLRWEITEPLNPGDGGVLRFKVRVR